jgi:thiol-disulfide isomerase/thioredoxin
MKKIFFLLFFAVIVLTCKSENPWVKKLTKKPLHSDTAAMFIINYSQLNKFDEDSTSNHVFFYYSGKKFGNVKEIFVDFPEADFSYYKLGDSAFLFDKLTNSYYQSDLKKDSLLLYFNVEVAVEALEPILFTNVYQPGFISSNPKNFNTTENNCIGLSYKSMPMGHLMSFGYEFDTANLFAKPCFCFAVIDTISRSFNSLYMKMDTSKVFGNNPVSLNYKFKKLEISSRTNDSIKQLIRNYRNTYKLTEITDNISFDKFNVKGRKNTTKELKADKIPDVSTPYLIPLLSLQGDSIKLDDFKGRYILLDFWFTNCPPCMRGIPKVNIIYEKFKARNLVVIGVNAIDKKMKAIEDVAIKKEMKYMVCKAPNNYENYFNVPSFPTYILISPDQKTFKTIPLHDDKELNKFIIELDKKLK